MVLGARSQSESWEGVALDLELECQLELECHHFHCCLWEKAQSLGCLVVAPGAGSGAVAEAAVPSSHSGAEESSSDQQGKPSSPEVEHDGTHDEEEVEHSMHPGCMDSGRMDPGGDTNVAEAVGAGDESCHGADGAEQGFQQKTDCCSAGEYDGAYDGEFDRAQQP